MRKKDIWGSYIKRSKANCERDIKELPGQVSGYSAVIRFTEGNQILYGEYKSGKTCLAADGYTWLMILPLDEYWCITAVYDNNSKIIEWYFDISRRNFIDENGVPCIDDLYLDLVLIPDGNILMLDEDELKEGLSKGIITKEDFSFAYKVFNEISSSEWTNVSYIRPFCDAILADYQ